MLIVISGPSGVGKGSICKQIIARDPSLAFSISATTRPPRPGEEDGKSYFFLTEEAFDELLAQDAFLEHALVHGRRYGTLRPQVEALLTEGRSVVLDIDVQGAENVMRLYPDCVSVFVYPPSFAELENRLRKRGTETEEQITLRLANAREEMKRLPSYRYAVLNDSLEEAIADTQKILFAERQRTIRCFPEID